MKIVLVFFNFYRTCRITKIYEKYTSSELKIILIRLCYYAQKTLWKGLKAERSDVKIVLSSSAELTLFCKGKVL